MNITKSITRAVGAVGMLISIASVAYSVYKLYPKFDKIDGVDANKLVSDINKKYEQKESEITNE